jgi:hypothetical protein
VLAGQVVAGAAVYAVILMVMNFLGLRRALWAKWKQRAREGAAGGGCAVGVAGVTTS